MQNAPREHSAILLIFIKLQFVFKNFGLSILSGRLRQLLPYIHLCLLLLYFGSSYSKQYGPRSDCSIWSSLIWAHTGCTQDKINLFLNFKIASDNSQYQQTKISGAFIRETTYATSHCSMQMAYVEDWKWLNEKCMLGNFT